MCEDVGQKEADENVIQRLEAGQDGNNALGPAAAVVVTHAVAFVVVYFIFCCF